MARPCEYVIVFRPLWMMLSLYGAWPQRVTTSGRLVPAALSLRGVATAVMFCYVTVQSWLALVGHIEAHVHEIPASDVPLRLLNLQFTVYVLCYPTFICFVLETRNNAQYAARWHEFQPAFQRVCGRRMRFDKLRRSVKATTASLGVGWPLFIAVPLTFARSDSHLQLSEIAFFTYVSTVLVFSSTNWRMHCAFMLRSSEMLLEALDKTLQRDTLTRMDVTRFMTTWLQLRDLVHDGARSIEGTAFFIITVVALNVVLCTFNTMYVIFNGFSKLGVFLTSVGFLTLMTMYRIFNAAYLVNQSLTHATAVTLARTPLNHLSKETMYEVCVFREAVVANPVKICLFGFLPINRNVLGALIVTSCTYLVVMAQYTVDSTEK